MNLTKRRIDMEWFDRSELKKVGFGKDDNDVWHLRTVHLDRNSLKIHIVKSYISDDTIELMVNVYLGIDVNSKIIVL